MNNELDAEMSEEFLALVEKYAERSHNSRHYIASLLIERARVIQEGAFLHKKPASLGEG